MAIELKEPQSGKQKDPKEADEAQKISTGDNLAKISSDAGDFLVDDPSEAAKPEDHPVRDEERADLAEVEESVANNEQSTPITAATVNVVAQALLLDDREQATVATADLTEPTADQGSARHVATTNNNNLQDAHDSGPASTEWHNPYPSDLITAELVDEDALRQQALEASVVATAHELKESPSKRRRRRTAWIGCLLFGVIAVVIVVTSVVVTGNSSGSTSSSNQQQSSSPATTFPTQTPTWSPAPSAEPTTAAPSSEPSSVPSLVPSQNPSSEPSTLGIFRRESLDGLVAYRESWMDSSNTSFLSGVDGLFGSKVEIISIEPGSYVSQFTNKTELVIANFGFAPQYYDLDEFRTLETYQRVVFYACDKDTGCDPGFFIHMPFFYKPDLSELAWDFAISEQGHRIIVCDGEEFIYWDFERLNISPTNREQGFTEEDNLLLLPNIGAGERIAMNKNGTLFSSLHDNTVFVYRPVVGPFSGPQLLWSWESLPEIDDQNATIAALSMSSDFVAIGVNLEDEINATDTPNDVNRTCTPCPVEKLFFDGFRVRVFDPENDRQVGNTITFDERYSIISGQSISLSVNGQILAVGLSKYAFEAFVLSEGRRDEAQVNVYTLQKDTDDNELWLPLGDPLISPVLGDAFGWSVSLDQTDESGALILAVGSPYDETPPFQRPEEDAKGAGKAQVFRFEGGQWKQLGEDLRGEGLVLFGSSVGITGKTLAVGIPYSNVYGNNTGEVVLYDLAEVT